MGAYDDPPERVRAAWDALQGAWDEPARHDAFLALATDADVFAWAAKQYRGRAGDAVADERLQRIQRAALARMAVTATRPKEKEKSYKMLAALVAILLVAVLVGVLLMDSLTKRGQPLAQPPPPAGLR